MKHFGIHYLLVLFTCGLSFAGLAQISSDFDGTYVGKFHPGGFEDSLIIRNETFTHVHNVAWGYGVEHLFIYSITPLKGEMISLEQMAYFKNREEQENITKTGEMDGETLVLTKDASDNLQLIYPGSGETIVFRKIDD